MAIAFNCPHCDFAYRLKDELAGKRATCKNPECRKLITIPTPITVPDDDAPVPDAAALEAAALSALADEPPLELKYRFYQRLLAQDYEDAADVAEEFLRSGSLDELYETMFVPALILAERDRDAGRLTAAQEAFVYESIAELAERLVLRRQTRRYRG